MKTDVLKKLLGIENEEQDYILQFILDTTVNKVLDYCNIEEIPDRLENTVYLICVDVYRKLELGSEKPVGEEVSVERGDTVIQFKAVSDIINSMDIFREYKHILKIYRVLRRG